MASDRRRVLGRRGEALALAHFERLGFELLARNHRTRAGEIDLVVFDGQATIVFVEVKTRCSGPGQPFDALGPAKRRQVRRLAADWLRSVQHPPARTLRFDAVAVTLDAHGRLVTLEHLEGAF
jgi:putative endonuclease